MTLTALLNLLHDQSGKKISDLIVETKLNRGFIQRTLHGENTMQRLDLLMQAYTGDVTAEEVIEAISFLRNYKKDNV